MPVAVGGCSSTACWLLCGLSWPHAGVPGSLPAPDAPFPGSPLQKLNEVAASLFISCEEARVAEGVGILNELIIPCMHLMNNFEISREDLDAIEVMRNRWCSYLGRDDMDGRAGLGGPSFCA